MNISRFKNNLMRLLCSTEGEEPFHALRLATGGLSAPKIAKIINYAVRCCYDTEFYCEIGVFYGYTLCSAAYQNEVGCIGVDDLSLDDFYVPIDKEALKKEFRDRIAKNIDNSRNKKVLFIEQDFRTFKISFEPAKTMGVFYIDGKHTYEQTKQAFEWAEPLLSDKAIIICDDLHMKSVEKIVLEKAITDEYKLLAYGVHHPFEGDYVLDEYISTGIAVLQYVRKLNA